MYQNFFLIFWFFCAWLLQIVIDVFIFDWTEAGQNLFDKLENIIGGILIYVPWYWYSWYLWFRRPKNIRFELKKDEKILLLFMVFNFKEYLIKLPLIGVIKCLIPY